MDSHDDCRRFLLFLCPKLSSRFRARSSSCLELRPTAVLDRRTFRLLLFRLLSFVRGERRTRREILGWTERAGRWGTKGFIIGQRCTGHGIKLSYAHLGIFYYYRERAFPPVLRLWCKTSFYFFSAASLSPFRASAGARAISRFSRIFLH